MRYQIGDIHRADDDRDIITHEDFERERKLRAVDEFLATMGLSA
jgi:hypothetical protein